MENKLLLNIIEDRHRKFQRDYALTSSDFLDMAQQSAVAGFVKGHGGEGVFFYGGYDGAERRKVIFVPDYLDVSGEDEVFDFFADYPAECPLRILEVKIGAKGAVLKHSDYLGSLLALGVRREKTGDILVFDDGAQIIVAEEIADYLAENYTKAGRVPLSASVAGVDRLRLSAVNVERVRLSLASPRLDNVVSAVFGLSRKSAAEAILGGRVFVNSAENKKPDFSLKGDEKLVLRGKGKAVYRGISGTSKKGKLYAEFDKYI